MVRASPEAAHAEREGKTPTRLAQEPPTPFPAARGWGCPLLLRRQGPGCTYLPRSIWGGAAQGFGNPSLAVQGVGTPPRVFSAELGKKWGRYHGIALSELQYDTL